MKRGPLHSLQHDISKAYDTVEFTIGKEMSMRRLGVPEWLMDIVYSLDNAAQVSVLTAHGLSASYHPETGWPQGSEEGPTGWLTHYDWHLQLHDEAKGRDPYLVDNKFQGDEAQKHVTVGNEDAEQWGSQCCCKPIKVFGPVYADDARWMSCTRSGIQKAAEIAEDFLGFHGGINNIPKSGLTSGTWAGNTDDPKAMGFKADMTPMSIQRVERQVSGEVQFETFICKTGYVAQKYLGLLATDTVTYGETEEMVGEQMKRLSDKAKAARNRAAGTAMIVLGVAVPKGNYPLKHISSSQDVLNAIWSSLEQVFTAGIGLPRTVNKHLKYSIIGSLADSTWIEKTVMLVLLLNRPDLAGDITRNETYNLQNLYGGLEPVLETRYNEEEMGWAGDWIGRLWQWMSANDIFIHGGTRLDKACIGDRSLTDIVQGKSNRCIRVGSMCYDLTNLAQIILPDGITFRQEVQESGIWNSHAHATDEWEGRNWPKYIREVLGKGTQKQQLTQAHALKGNRRGNVWFQLGKEVVFRMTHHGEMKIGRIVGHCKGWLAVEAWIPQGRTTKSTRHRNGLPRWTKPESAEKITIKDTQAFPISTTLIRTGTSEMYSVDDSAEWIDEWWKHIGSGSSHEEEQEVTEQQVQAEEEVEKPWKYDTGKGLVEMSPKEPDIYTNTIWAVSDGGVREAGTHKAKGGYGYIIKTNREEKGWGSFGYTMAGRGMVEGNNMYMDSTRAEARGLLATMLRLLASIKRYPNIKTIDHATDNEAVVDIYAGMQGRTTAEWLRATDTDIWHEIKQAEAKFTRQGIKYKVRWIRSHPEKRHTWLSDWNEDDVMNSMADSLATLAMEEYIGMGNTEIIQASDSTKVWYAYTQEKGGKKMRITGNLRQMLKCHIQFRHYGTYLETSQASHIKGQNLGKICIK